jgi:hypothetical protein
MTVTAVTWEVDRDRRLTILRLVGDVNGKMLLDRIETFWRAEPECIGNQCIVDMRAFVGDLTYYDLVAIAKRWREVARERDAGRGIAIVTRDRFAGLMLKVVALLFTTRRFALFNDMDDALRWIDAAPPDD